MESVHKRKLNEKYPHLLRQRRVIVLGIRDEYEYMDERLVAALRGLVVPHLRQ